MHTALRTCHKHYTHWYVSLVIRSLTQNIRSVHWQKERECVLCSHVRTREWALVSLVPAHWSLAIHGETQRGSGASECQAVPVPAPPRPSLLPSAQSSAQGCETTEPPYQWDGRTQTRRFWYIAPLYSSLTVIELFPFTIYLFISHYLFTIYLCI